MAASTRAKLALLSVSNKDGIVDFGTGLVDAGYTLLSTGGTARALRDAGLEVTDVSAYTGHPEILDGRVKTLHPKVHGGLLARRDDDAHLTALDDHDISCIDVVAVNLYPFQEVAKKNAEWDVLIENIDIGGPSMLRSAAKNHAAVTVVCDPADYADVLRQLQAGTDLSTRKKLALKAFAHTAAYDAFITQTLTARVAADDANTLTPPVVDGEAIALRYGENPHQAACVLPTEDGGVPLAQVAPLQGKALSYNNLLDADAAFFALRCLVDGKGDAPGCVIIKHGTPTGAAQHAEAKEAFLRAKSGDPLSAFGGIVAMSGTVDEDTALAMGEMFLEVIVAEHFSDDAKAVFAKKKNLRLLELPTLRTASLPTVQTRSVAGGLLVQEHDRAFTGIRDANVVTQRAPTDAEWDALDLAFRMSTAVRSNAITFANAEKLLSAGGGQTSRVDAVELAVKKAAQHGHRVDGAAMGSDAFFPFADGVLAAIQAGITCVAQPGGSKRDEEVIAACNEHNVAMVMTGERHFRH